MCLCDARTNMYEEDITVETKPSESTGAKLLVCSFDWWAPDLAEPSSLPAGRRWAAGRSPSAPPRTAGSRWSAGSAWSPEEATEGERHRERTSWVKDGKITVSAPRPTPAGTKTMNSHLSLAARGAWEQRRWGGSWLIGVRSVEEAAGAWKMNWNSSKCIMCQKQQRIYWFT